MRDTAGMRSLSVLLLLLTLSLTACGGDEDDDPGGGGDSGAGSDVPAACEDLFVDGAEMPAEAEDGCFDEDADTIVVSFTQDCADGRLLILNPRGYGIVGEETRLPAPGDDEPDVNSAEYREVLADCEGLTNQP